MLEDNDSSVGSGPPDRHEQAEAEWTGRTRRDAVLNQTGTQSTIWADILLERERQDRKHGPEQKAPDLEQLSWLMEELGEVAKGLIDKESEDAVDAEIVQVAALAVKWLEARKQRRAM